MFGSKVPFLLLSIVLLCSGDYINIDGHTYYMNLSIKRNWFKANQFCELLGMNLLDIRTEAELGRIKRAVQEFNRRINNSETFYYWTGGSDHGDENRFYWWKTGIPIEFDNWTGGQPDNYEAASGEREHCVHVASNTHKWNDMTCSAKYPFICRDTIDTPQYMTNIQSC